MPTLLLLGDLAPVALHTLEIATDAAAHDALVLANLESPLCAASLPARPKAGPALRASPESLAPLAAAFPQLALNLANNHSFDFGAPGLDETLATCARHRVATFGAGENLTAATAPRHVTHAGLRLALLGACERQFGHAEPHRAGTAPFSAGLFARTAEARRDTDRVIVSVHGAAEMSPWPAPRWQEALRALVDAGADIVHGHHAHVSQGFERHGRGWIVYGAGNTLVNPAQWPEAGATLRSLRFAFELADLTRAPLVSEWTVASPAPGSVALRRASLDEARLAACNIPLADPVLLAALWQETAAHLWDSFYGAALRPGVSTRERTALVARSLRDSALSVFTPAAWAGRADDRRRFLYHLFACEHHAEAISTALAVQTGEIPDRRSAESRRLAHAWLPGAAAGGATP